MDVLHAKAASDAYLKSELTEDAFYHANSCAWLQFMRAVMTKNWPPKQNALGAVLQKNEP